MKMPTLKQTILLVGTPAVMLVGGLTTMAASAATPPATPSLQTQPAAEPAEAIDSANAAEPASGAAEPASGASESAADAAEPALPGGGHADAGDQNADHQFEGVE